MQAFQAERSQVSEAEAAIVYEDPQVGQFGWNKFPTEWK